MSTVRFLLDRRAFLAVGVSSAALAACSNIIGPPEAAPIYMLRPPVGPSSGGPRVPWQLSVVLPTAPDSLDTNRIALMQPGGQMDYYANAIWQDHLPSLVQTALVEAFETSNRIAAVGRDSEDLRADYLLQTDIRDFQARYDVQDAPPTAVVRLQAKLVTMHGRIVALTVPAQGEAQAAQNNVASVVSAFDQALAAALKQIVDAVLSAPMPPAR